MKSKSRTVPPVPQDESALRHLPLVDLLVDTKTELYELAFRSGLKVFMEMLEEDRTAICGPRYAHEPDRTASRAGTARSEVVLGGRKVAIRRPRARTADGEVPLPTFQVMAKTEPLDRRVVEQIWSVSRRGTTPAAWSHSM
jgi:putative transposase